MSRFKMIVFYLLGKAKVLVCFLPLYFYVLVNWYNIKPKIKKKYHNKHKYFWAILTDLWKRGYILWIDYGNDIDWE